MKTDIENKDGTVSPYGFMCGYMEIYGDWMGGNGVRLFADGCYHVKGLVIQEGMSTFIWETFDHVTEARKFARQFGKLRK